MKSFFDSTFLAFISLLISSGSLLAQAPVSQFRSDNPALTLTGVWSISGKGLSVGIKNTGTNPIRAFRSQLLKLNDFDEGKPTFDIEFSSESEFHSARERVESPHILQPGETLFFNVMVVDPVPKIFFSEISYVRMLIRTRAKSQQAIDKTEREILSDARSLLQVSKIVFNASAISKPRPEAR